MDAASNNAGEAVEWFYPGNDGFYKYFYLDQRYKIENQISYLPRIFLELYNYDKLSTRSH